MSRRPRPRWAGCRPCWTPMSWRPGCPRASRRWRWTRPLRPGSPRAPRRARPAAGRTSGAAGRRPARRCARPGPAAWSGPLPATRGWILPSSATRRTPPRRAATRELNRGRTGARPTRPLPPPDGLAFPCPRQAAPLEPYATIKKNGRWVMRNCGAVLSVPSLDAIQASPADVLALIRGHWTIEHLHWLRDMVWHEDKSTIRTGNAPQVISALTNLVITLFRLQGVTKITEETRRNAQDPRRALQLLALRPG